MGVSQELNVTYLIFVGTVIILILVSSIVFFFYLYQRKLYRQEQEMTTMAIRYQEELLYANWNVIEEERKRLSAEFHDDIGSIFSTLSLQLSTLAAHNGVADLQREKVVQQSRQLIDTGIKNMRRILYDIVPPDIDVFGLSDTVVTLCERINNAHKIHISFQETGIPFLWTDKKHELILYRIIQELINNTLKHSGADKAELYLVWTNELLVLSYRDNGKGFDMVPGNQTGLGMKNIQSRAKMINATVSFQSAEKMGMSFSLNYEPQSANHD